jgi:fatty acid desaturase
MAPFETHVRVGVGVHFALTTASLVVPALGGPIPVVVATLISLPVTVGGAVFPDVDHHASRSYRLARQWLPRVCTGTVGLALGANVESLVRAVDLVGGSRSRSGFYAGCLYCLVLWGVGTGVRRAIPICRPPHRTVTHAASTALIVSGFLAACGVALVASVAPDLPALLGSVCGLCFFAGVVSHLHCDGLVTIPGVWSGPEE